VATTVTSQLIENGPRNVVYKFTAVGDTDESAVAKITPTSAGPLGNNLQGNAVYPGVHLSILDLWFNVASGCLLEILWDADTDVQALVLAGTDHWRFTRQRGGIPGLTSPAAAGATGIIRFTTHGLTAAVPTGFGGYTVIMALAKNIGGQPPPPS
jgi:hypothetical protein